MFSDSPDVRVYFHGGIWHGKQGAKRLYIDRFQTNFTHGRNGPRHGTEPTIRTSRPSTLSSPCLYILVSLRVFTSSFLHSLLPLSFDYPFFFPPFCPLLPPSSPCFP